jgi:hypothetical protein
VPWPQPLQDQERGEEMIGAAPDAPGVTLKMALGDLGDLRFSRNLRGEIVMSSHGHGRNGRNWEVAKSNLVPYRRRQVLRYSVYRKLPEIKNSPAKSSIRG